MGELAKLPQQAAAELSGDIIESLVLDGDLGKISPGQRVAYYVHRCRVLGIDPGEQPFQLIRLNGKLTLYATKTCANALTRVNKLSVEIKSRTIDGSLVIVEARASDTEGRFADDLGVLDLDDADNRKMGRPNALMKCATKAKRRAVLALVGLGVLDVSEVEDIRGAQRVRLDVENGEIEPERDTVPNAIDVEVQPRNPAGLGPRCSGKAAGLAKGNDERIGELAELAKRNKGTAWRAVLKQSGIDLPKYVEADGEPPREPASLTVDDGKTVRAWLDSKIAELRGPESSGPTPEPGQAHSPKQWVISTYAHLCEIGECSKEAEGDNFAAWAGLESWPEHPTADQWGKCADGLGTFVARLEDGQ